MKTSKLPEHLLSLKHYANSFTHFISYTYLVLSETLLQILWISLPVRKLIGPSHKFTTKLTKIKPLVSGIWLSSIYEFWSEQVM